MKSGLLVVEVVVEVVVVIIVAYSQELRYKNVVTTKLDHWKIKSEVTKQKSTVLEWSANSRKIAVTE